MLARAGIDNRVRPWAPGRLDFYPGLKALTVQVAAGTQAEVRDKSVARIFTALNLSHRFRWEIIDFLCPFEEASGVPR